MNLIDLDNTNVTWSPPSDRNPFRAVKPTVDNHVDSERYSPFSLIEVRAKGSCMHRIDSLERNGFRSRM